MKLSKHFSLKEFIKSDTAEKNDIDNSLPEDKQNNAIGLCMNVLEPIREKFGRVNITSGYRCLDLNRKIHSKDTSQHVKAEASDIQVPGAELKTVFQYCIDNVDFDQIILEDNGISAWIHISWTKENRRKHAMTAEKVNGRMHYFNV